MGSFASLRMTINEERAGWQYRRENMGSFTEFILSIAEGFRMTVEKEVSNQL